jgi:hypothetical protein
LPLQPPRDQAGNVIPHDDPAIADDSYVVRHINPEAHLAPDENTGGSRISTGAFNRTREPNGGISVDLGQELIAAGLPLNHMVQPGMGAVKISVGAVRRLTLWVGSDPIIAEHQGDAENPHHGQIWNGRKKTPRDLYKAIEDWVVQLPGVALR